MVLTKSLQNISYLWIFRLHLSTVIIIQSSCLYFLVCVSIVKKILEFGANSKNLNQCVF